MSKVPRFALVGDDPDLAEQLVRALRERGFDLERVRLLGDADREGEFVEVDDVRLRVDRADSVSMAGADVVIVFGAGEPPAAGLLPEGALVLDATPGASARTGRTPIVPEVNAERIGELAGRGALVLPDPATVGLAVALAPLHAAATVRRVVTTVLYPASRGGGVERLSRQAVNLMQGRSLDPDVDPEHLAFNLRPHAGAPPSPWSRAEQRLVGEIGSLFGDPRVEVLATGVQAPVFYGIAQSVLVETESPLDVDEAERLLLRGRGLLVPGPASIGRPEELEPGETLIEELTDLSPGPVEVAGSDAVHVAHLRVDPWRPNALAFWICFDDQRKGFALNAIGALEVALRDARA